MSQHVGLGREDAPRERRLHLELEPDSVARAAGTRIRILIPQIPKAYKSTFERNGERSIIILFWAALFLIRVLCAED